MCNALRLYFRRENEVQTGGHWPPASNSTKYAENVIL